MMDMYIIRLIFNKQNEHLWLKIIAGGIMENWIK